MKDNLPIVIKTLEMESTRWILSKFRFGLISEYPDDDEKQSSKAGTRQAAMFFPSDLDGTNSDSAIEQSAAPPWNKPSRSLPASQASSPTQPCTYLWDCINILHYFCPDDHVV